VFPLERLLLWHWAVQALRVLFVFYLFGCLWMAGHLVGRLFRLAVPDVLAERLIEIALGFGVFSLVLRCLGAAGLAVREVVLGLLLIPSLLLLRSLRARSLPPFPVPRPHGKWTLGALALLPLPMALAPAVSTDALVYQLRFPEMTLWTGRWAIDPANSTSFFPAASETLYLYGLSVDGSGICAQLIHYGFFLLTLAALLALGRTAAGPAGGATAARLFASIPAAGIVAGWSWSDMTLCFALLASALALSHEEVAPAVALLGLAAATKYSGAALALALAAAAAVIAVRRRRFGALLAGAGAAVLVALPWYLFNWIRMGNPVYPLLPRLFGGPAGVAERIVNWSGSASKTSWVSYVSRPDTIDSDVGGIGLVLLLAAAIVHAVSSRRRRPVAAVVLAGVATLIPFAPAARILLPPLAGGCLLAGIAFEDLRENKRARWAALLSVVVVFRGAVLIAAHNALFFNPVPCATGIEKPEEYRQRNFPADALFARADEKLPDAARVLVFGESRLFRFPRPTTASSRVDPPAVLPYLRRAAAPEEVVARLRKSGITHLLVSLDALRSTPEALVWKQGLSEAELSLLSRVLQRCRALDRQDSLVLLELPPPPGPAAAPLAP
jgi:hypothetical protein